MRNAVNKLSPMGIAGQITSLRYKDILDELMCRHGLSPTKTHGTHMHTHLITPMWAHICRHMNTHEPVAVPVCAHIHESCTCWGPVCSHLHVNPNPHATLRPTCTLQLSREWLPLPMERSKAAALSAYLRNPCCFPVALS